jgi:hypothetical protein
MNSFTAPPLSFLPRRPDDWPGPLTTAAASRRFVELREARDASRTIPGPGESVHCLMTGRYDLMYILIGLIESLGPVDQMRIATLAYSARNLTEMVALLDSEHVKALTLLCSSFFRGHYGDVWESTLEQFRARGQRAAAARSHCKIVTMAFTSGRRLTLEGSANLRSNSNREQLMMADGAELHDWHARWIDDLVARHEGDDDGAGDRG